MYDAPLIRIFSVPGRSEKLNTKRVLIRPNGRATGQIPVSTELEDGLVDPCTRSRRARCGFHVGPNGSTRANPQGILSVSIYNWSPAYGLVITEEDFIALVPDRWPENFPLVKRIPLIAGHTFLQMKTALLPKANSIPYFDPYTMHMHDYMEEVRYGEIKLKAYDFLVVQAEQHEPVPDGCTGVITSAVRQWLHNSARYAHGGPNERLALEYKIFEPTMLNPGKHIANLAIYETPSSPPYTGELGKQNTLIPATWK